MGPIYRMRESMKSFLHRGRRSSLRFALLPPSKPKQIRRGEAAAPEEEGGPGGARRKKGRQQRWIWTQWSRRSPTWPSATSSPPPPATSRRWLAGSPAISPSSIPAPPRSVAPPTLIPPPDCGAGRRGIQRPRPGSRGWRARTWRLSSLFFNRNRCWFRPVRCWIAPRGKLA